MDVTIVAIKDMGEDRVFHILEGAESVTVNEESAKMFVGKLFTFDKAMGEVGAKITCSKATWAKGKASK